MVKRKKSAISLLKASVNRSAPRNKKPRRVEPAKNTSSENEGTRSKVRVVSQYITSGRSRRTVTFEDDSCSDNIPRMRSTIPVVDVDGWYDEGPVGDDTVNDPDGDSSSAEEPEGTSNWDFDARVAEYLFGDGGVSTRFNTTGTSDAQFEDGDDDDDGIADAADPTGTEPLKEKVKPIEEWRDLRDMVLLELHAHDAGPIGSCSVNSCSEPATHRCLSCITHCHVCRSCVVSNHQHTPFHRVEVHSTFIFWYRLVAHRCAGMDWTSLDTDLAA